MATRAEVEAAIARLEAVAPCQDLRLLAEEYRIVHECALRLERIIHEMIKAAEEAHL